MKKKLYLITALSCFLAVLFTIFYAASKASFWESIAITFATISYHFVMRLMVGGAYHLLMNNRADYRKKWYSVGPKEQEFYKKLKVKKWKNLMPTYDAEQFDPAVHSWDEIIQATCQAELVHETIIVLSFLPIAAGWWLGAEVVFVITSFAAAFFDGIFVIMQRFNRPRILRILEKVEARGKMTCTPHKF